MNNNIKSKSVLLYDTAEKRALFEKNPDMRLPFASIVKVITAILAIEKCPDPENTFIKMETKILNDVLPFEPALSALSLYPGRSFPALDFIYASLLNSGCEAARELAFYIGDGDIRVYLDKAARLLHKLDCKDTKVIEPTGLMDEGQYSTARDITKFFMYAMENPLFARVVSTVQYKSQYFPETVDTTNALINPKSEFYNACVIGGKTGTTDEAGRCLVCEYEKEGKRYILVSLGFPFIDTVENKNQFFGEEISRLLKSI